MIGSDDEYQTDHPDDLPSDSTSIASKNSLTSSAPSGGEKTPAAPSPAPPSNVEGEKTSTSKPNSMFEVFR